MSGHIAIQNLRFHYLRGRSEALLAIDNNYFKTGEQVWLKGINGSGKTTLLKLLAGLLPDRQSSIVLYDDKGLPLNLKQRQRRILYLHPTPYLFDMTVKKNLQLCHSIFNPKPQAVEQVCELFMLQDIMHINTRQLSSGQRQQVALARAWLRAPDFLLLDESLAHLDSDRLDLVNQILGTMSDNGCGIIRCAHQSESVNHCPLRSITLEQGRIYGKNNFEVPRVFSQ